MIDNVGAIEVDILDKRTAIVAIKDYMFVLARRTAAFNHNADCVRRPDGRMRHIRWNEERFAFANQMIDDLVAFSKFNGWERLYWHTEETNTVARALYDHYVESDGHIRYRIIL